MRSKELLANDLESINGWKAMGLSGLLKSFLAKKYFKRYKDADWKGVADVVVLRRDKHDDLHYAVIAFSTKGSLSEETIAILKERVNEFPVNNVRYESTGNGGFYPMVSDSGEHYQEDYIIERQAEDMDGVYVTSFSVSNPEKLNCPYIIYAHSGDMLYKYHVDARYL